MSFEDQTLSLEKLKMNDWLLEKYCIEDINTGKRITMVDIYNDYKLIFIRI